MEMKQLTLILQFVTITFFSACSPIQLQYVGDDRGLEIAHQAAQQWEDVCGKDIFISRDKTHIQLREVKDIHKILPNSPAYISAATGYGLDKKPNIVLFEPYGSDQDIQYLLAHEFGHVLGIKEHQPDGLMTVVMGNKPTDLIVTKSECQQLP